MFFEANITEADVSHPMELPVNLKNKEKTTYNFNNLTLWITSCGRNSWSKNIGSNKKVHIRNSPIIPVKGVVSMCRGTSTSLEGLERTCIKALFSVMLKTLFQIFCHDYRYDCFPFFVNLHHSLKRKFKRAFQLVLGKSYMQYIP